MKSNQLDDVLSLLAGECSVAEVATRHAVTEAEVESWRSFYVAGLRAKGRRRSFISPKMAIIAAALVFGFFGTYATAQTACSTYPGLAGLKTFCPNAPAIANDVNGNFAQVVSWIQNKTGSVSSNNITTPNLTVTGTSVLNGSLTVGGATLLSNATTSNLTANGTVTFNSSDVVYGSINGRGNGGRAMVLDTGDTLVLGFGGDFQGGVRLDSPIKFTTTGTANRTPTEKSTAGGGIWGQDDGTTYCDAGQFVCGVRLYTEPNQGSNADDTALNDFNIICCNLGN